MNGTWCYEESCRYRDWRSGSMPTHKRGSECPEPRASVSEAAVARLAAKRTELGAEDFGAYAFLAFGLLAHQAPEVANFVLDRADGVLAE